MALNSLVSGADCGPSNALSQVIKHSEADRSLQRDRIGPSTSGPQLRHLPSSGMAGPSMADAAHAQQFFNPNAGPSSSLQIAPFCPPVALGHSPTPLPQAAIPGPSAFGEAWARGAGQQDILSDAWSRGATATTGPQATTPQPSTQVTAPIGGYAGQTTMPFHAPMMGSAPFMMYSSQWSQPQLPAEPVIQGKGKGREIDPVALDKAFEQITLAENQEATTQESETKEDQRSEFEKIWNQLHLAPDSDDYAKWEAEYHQVLQSQRESGEEGLDFDYGGDMQRAWETSAGQGLSSDMGMTDLPEELERHIDENGMPILPSYKFEPNNPHLATPAGELLAKAKRFIAENGSLSEACLMIEAAIQKGELGEGGYEAWVLLGETQSMDEHDDLGLLALREGVNVAKAGGHVGPGMIPLAVAYTNEGYDTAAHSTLREWLRSAYPQAHVPEPTADQVMPWLTNEITQEAFLNVARGQHTEGKPDPDVQVGLGVLYFAEGDYAKAKDCFEAALWARPGDYLLWNRLGSCLSNGQKPEEALGVYREALRLRPTYTRAIFNVGVACLNIGARHEAAEHFMTALAIQKTSGQPVPGKSDQLWKMLKKTFLEMGESELANLTDKQDVELFRNHGYEF